MKNRLNKKDAADVTGEECDVLPDDLLRAIARLKGRAVPQKGVPVPVSILYPVSSARAVEERRQEEARRKADEEVLKNATPGQKMPGHGIYLGKYAPKNRNGRSLGKIFNVFAAPQDLTDDDGERAQLTYEETVKHFSALKNWHDHAGEAYANDTELYAALESGSYKGGWVIPTRELLFGLNAYGDEVQPDNILKHVKAGTLKGTFSGAVGWDDSQDTYLSCTEWRDNTGCVEIVSLATGEKSWASKVYGQMSCRPVRLEPVP